MSTAICLLLAATIPLRNPFWPVGYVGERESISERPKIQIKATADTASEEDTRTSVTAEAIAAAEAEVVDDQQYADRLWIGARKSLRIGGTMRTVDESGSHQSVTINGAIYGDGDLISTNFEGRRFTWKIKNLTEGGTLKLQRIKVRELEEGTDNKEGE